MEKVMGKELYENRKKEFVNTGLDVLATMSANLAGGALLA